MVEIIGGLDTPNIQAVTKRVVAIVNPHFKFDVTSRISVRSDMGQFKAKEDKNVWLQGRGKIPHYFECYWDGVWLCDFWETMSGAEFLHQFLIGFKNAFENDQITINELTPEEIAQRRQEDTPKAEDIIAKEIKKIKKQAPERTIEEKLVKQTNLELLEEKKQEKKQNRKKVEKRYGR